MIKNLIALFLSATCLAQVVECDYDGVITPTTALHFQSGTDLVNWQPIGTITNVQPFSNSVPITLVPPVMFFRVLASNEWGVADSNILTSAPPSAVKLKIKR